MRHCNFCDNYPRTIPRHSRAYRIVQRHWLHQNAIITYLLAELKSLKINVKKLYLDRGFFNTPVIRWLQALDIPLMMPAIKTGKSGGIKQFLKGKKSYKTTYTITRDKDDSVEER